MTDESPRIRQALGDRYVLEREVGAGGVATVYLAHDLKHGRPVAVKVLRSELSGSIASERFLREIQITASLTHPNVVPLFDSGEKDGVVYFVMPYHEASSLAHRLEQERQLPVSEAVRIACEVAEALSHAHRHGVIHRDIKPSNVLLAEGHAMVADFGIGRAVRESATGDLTSSGVAIGTPAYMSPEQASGLGDTDERSDIYALGCVLYEMLAGIPPFHAATAIAMVARHLSEPPPPLRIARPAVSEELEAVVDTALAKLPADRFPTADAFLQALRATQTGARRAPGEPASFTPADGRPRDAGSGASRRRFVRPTVATVGVTIAVVAALFAVRSIRHRGASELASNRIVVFPLADVNGDGNAGADVALVLGMALEHTDPLKWIDGWSLLDPDVRSDPRRLSAEQARTLARERGAAFYLDGNVLHRGDSVSVTLLLHDTQGDSLVDRASRSALAAATTPDRLGLQAVVQLLPALVEPGRKVDVTYLTDRDPAAVAIWIQGEREYRQARFRPALELFNRAVGADSLLVPAALKGAQAAAWAHEPELGEELARVALAHEGYLPPRHRALARGFLAYEEGRADSAVAALRAALAEDDEWGEAWMLLGEVHRHLILSDVVIGVSAPESFRRAALVDPSFLPPLIHLAEYALRDDSLEVARRYLRRLEASGADPATISHLPVMLTCIEQGAEALDWSAQMAADTQAVLEAGVQLAVGGTHLPCAEPAFRVIRERGYPRQWGGMLGLHGTLVAEGRFDESQRLLEASADSGTVAARMLEVLDVFAGAPTEEGARGFVELVRQSTGGTFTGLRNPLGPWLVGLWLAHEGDLTDLAKVEAGVRATMTANTPLFAASLAGFHALAEGDTTQAMAIFVSLPDVGTPNELNWDLGAGFPVERLTVACLHLARGEAREAVRVATLLEHPQPLGFLPFLGESLRVRLEAARVLGDAPLERTFRTRLQELGRSDLIARAPCTSIQGDEE